jgi:hypothetical protein
MKKGLIIILVVVFVFLFFFVGLRFYAYSMVAYSSNFQEDINYVIEPMDSILHLSVSEITLGQTDVDEIVLSFTNLDLDQALIYIESNSLASGGVEVEGLDCLFLNTHSIDSGNLDVVIDQGISLPVEVRSDGLELGTYVCSFTLYGYTSQEKVHLVVKIV